MNKSSLDSIARSAIWNAHGYKCLYCGKDLDWDELHIDHIIPEYLSAQPEQLKEIISDYNLGVDFNINGYMNLVPSHGKCNQRKGDMLFSKGTCLFYLEQAKLRLPLIEEQQQKIKKRRNRGMILSKVENALDSGLISLMELKKHLAIAEQKHWDVKEVKLPDSVSFIDKVYDAFYLNEDYSYLLDESLNVGKEAVDVINDNNVIRHVTSVNEWNKALVEGFNCVNNLDIKCSMTFEYVQSLLSSLQQAKMPKVSFMSDPWIDIDEMKYLSPTLLPDNEERTLAKYASEGLSMQDLVDMKVVTVRMWEIGIYKFSLQFDWLETSFKEVFRADFNNDGIEDVLVKGWTNAIGGTFGYGFTEHWCRKSTLSLIEKIDA
jgi:hypothetical protein